MNGRRRYYIICWLLNLLTGSGELLSQTPDFSAVPNLKPGDSQGITNLINNGVEARKGKVIAWFPKDSLSEAQVGMILDTLNIGVIAAERVIKAPLAWQVHQEAEPYTFYFRLDSFVSHASGAGFVSIPFWRIKQGRAPWLHEAIHEMLNTNAGNWTNASVPDEVWANNMPLWLSEGLPDYITLRVSQDYNLPQYDVFTNSFQTNVDSACKEDLKGVRADSILSYIGKKGAMEALFGNDRRLYAPTFYHCSCSFVKYLAEEVQVDKLIASLAAYPKEMEKLEASAVPSVAALKKRWLIKINGK
jgi:hypothetical protein